MFQLAHRHIYPNMERSLPSKHKIIIAYQSDGFLTQQSLPGSSLFGASQELQVTLKVGYVGMILPQMKSKSQGMTWFTQGHTDHGEAGAQMKVS